MDLQLKNKAVLVTAASKGLGKATAHTFAEEGAHVLLSSRDENELKRAKEDIIRSTGNDNVRYALCDMGKNEDIQRLVHTCVEWNGTVDVLVNNTGGPPSGSFTDMSDTDWQRAFELTTLSFIRTIREVLPYMKKQQNGRILNFTSSSIKEPIDHLVLSNTFRAGINGLTKSLAQELAEDHILINTLGPGRIATERMRQLTEGVAEKEGRTFGDVREEEEKEIPLGRLGTPEEFARHAVFLCSGVNTYVTGQALLVDGGLVKAL